MRRFLIVLVLVATAISAVDGPLRVEAGRDDYAATCTSRVLGVICGELIVLDKAYSDRFNANDMGWFQLTCTRRSGARCTNWRVVRDGFVTDALPVGALSLLGTCVVKRGDVPDDPAGYGGAARGDFTFVDRDCDGHRTDLDRVRLANSFTTHEVLDQHFGTMLLTNITMVNGSRNGYVTANSCEQIRPGPQSTSNGNHAQSAAIANLALVPIDRSRFCLYNSVDVNVVVDIQGRFSIRSGLRLLPESPLRLIDTREQPSGKPAAGTLTRVDTGLRAGTEAVLVNVTMTGGVAPGFISAGPCDAFAHEAPSSSTGNFGVATAIANLAVVPVDTSGVFCIYNSAGVDLVVDLQGRFIASDVEGDGLSGLATSRVLDTRMSLTPAAGSITRVRTGTAPGTTAALVNLTMADGNAAGYVTADRCDALSPGPQTRSSGNFSGPTAVANLAVVPVDSNGEFCIFNSSAVELIVDVQGAFSPTGPLQFSTLASGRLYDSRAHP